MSMGMMRDHLTQSLWYLWGSRAFMKSTVKPISGSSDAYIHTFYIYTRIQTHAYIQTYIHTNKHKHTCIQTYIHTNIHAYIHPFDLLPQQLISYHYPTYYCVHDDRITNTHILTYDVSLLSSTSLLCSALYLYISISTSLFSISVLFSRFCELWEARDPPNVLSFPAIFAEVQELVKAKYPVL